MAAVTNYHKRSDDKTTRIFYLTVLEVRRPQIKVSVGLTSFWRFYERIHFLGLSRSFAPWPFQLILERRKWRGEVALVQAQGVPILPHPRPEAFLSIYSVYKVRCLG